MSVFGVIVYIPYWLTGWLIKIDFHKFLNDHLLIITYLSYTPSYFPSSISSSLVASILDYLDDLVTAAASTLLTWIIFSILAGSRWLIFCPISFSYVSSYYSLCPPLEKNKIYIGRFTIWEQSLISSLISSSKTNFLESWPQIGHLHCRLG